MYSNSFSLTPPKADYILHGFFHLLWFVGFGQLCFETIAVRSATHVASLVRSFGVLE